MMIRHQTRVSAKGECRLNLFQYRATPKDTLTKRILNQKVVTSINQAYKKDIISRHDELLKETFKQQYQ